MAFPVLQLCYAATAPIEAEHVRADPDSHLGWWSDRLEARTPSWLVGARCQSTAPVAILSVLRTVDAGAISRTGNREGRLDAGRHVVRARRPARIDDRQQPLRCRDERPFSRAMRVVSKS